MEKTIAVRVERLFPHKRLKRVMRRSRKYLVHDESGTAGVGDTVSFEETKPMSKNKRWTLVGVINKAREAAVEEPDDTAEPQEEQQNA
jgi:small subunit ribosomal protein S17